MVSAFADFVAAASKIVVGIIIFVIIVVIQFVVITKGATRISEVAARFALDGMPGKQMAIDADLNAGIIDEREAQARRSEITRQADFYGAMDGASKFVRGDAIAGIIITVINIVGGLIIGMAEFGMTLRRSGAALHAAHDRRRPGEPGAGVLDFARGRLARHAQHAERRTCRASSCSRLFSRPQALAVTGGFLAILMFTSLPRMPLLALGGACLGLARHDRRGAKRRRPQTAAKQGRGRKESRSRRKSASRIISRSTRWRSSSASG